MGVWVRCEYIQSVCTCSRQDSRIGNGWLMRTCFTTVASTLWLQCLIVTEHHVHRLTTRPCPHNEGLDAGVVEGWRRSWNLLLSLILHSPGLLIRGKALNHDCVPSVEPAEIPCLEMSPREQPPFRHQQMQKWQTKYACVCVCVCVHCTFTLKVFSFNLSYWKLNTIQMGAVCMCVTKKIYY